MSSLERGAEALDAMISNKLIGEIDYEAYAQLPDSAKVQPASSFCQAVIERFYGDKSKQGGYLPWDKTHDKVRLRPAELSIWTGFKGHGKSLLLSQILLDLVASGDRAFILSPEFSPEEILARKVRQSACIREPSIEYIKAWHQWTDGKLWLYNHQGATTPNKVIGLLRYCHEKFGINHTVVDSLMKCGISPDDYKAQKHFVDQLQIFAHDTRCHVHLVAHARKGDDDSRPAGLHDVKGTSEICDMAENVFSVWKNKRKIEESGKPSPNLDIMAQPDCKLVCDSQRNGEWTGTFGLWFHHESGQFMSFANARPKDYMPWRGSSVSI